MPIDATDQISNKVSNSSDLSSASQRPRRLAAIRGKQRSPDDPCIYC